MELTTEFRAAIRLPVMLFLVCCFSGCDVQEDNAVAEQTAQVDGKTEANVEDKLTADKKQPHTNRLARETSPYLLLHAHNPVDWYPWGPEAFEKAKREGKPIFLSIGYSSCYWCHVMERQVFTNEKIAAYMNEHFVNIKVDREERPDVDDIYMTSLSLYFQLAGSQQGGGWPLSMFLTPQGKPFAGGTYFPPDDKQGRMGFPKVMARIVELWKENRDQVQSTADLLVREVRRAMKPRLQLQAVEIERELVANATTELLDSYDSEFGGIDFHGANPHSPKFPVPAKLALLQYEIRRHGNDEAANVVYHTLDAIAAGGIRDHLGGGFHRYSTDRYWHVPHFEKMLYDQAQLADVYTEAFRQTGKLEYREAVEGIFSFVFRELTDAQGGFYSALDAETNGIEGEYYVWSKEDVEQTLGDKDSAIFQTFYGMQEPKVFEHGYVLHTPKPLAEAAKDLKIPPDVLKQRLSAAGEKMLVKRGQREKLLLDDKILTSWNGLMIRAFAHAGKVFQNDEYLAAAKKAALFVLAEMRDENGQLRRTYRDHRAKLNAYLDDYAFLVEGLLALYDVTGEEKWLNAARRLTDDQLKMFWDEDGNAFFFTSHHHEELIARTKNAYDAVLPSGNSVSVRNLVRLASLSGQETYREHAREILELFAPSLKQNPRGLCNMALALGEFLDDPDFKSGKRKTPPTPKVSTPNPIPNGDVNPNPAGVLLEVAGDKNQKVGLVSAKAFLSLEKLPVGGTCRIAVLLDIKPGWHINANPAKPDFLVATSLKIKSRYGTKIDQIKYPAAKQAKLGGMDEVLHVYEGRVIVYGLLSVVANPAEKLEDIELQVKYQACDDKRCLAPKTITLKGRIPFSSPGEVVRKINPQLFPEPKSR